MSVLIKGMGFPAKENFMTQLYLICDKDGNWYAVDSTNKDLYKLIEVKEPHGRLIDIKSVEYGKFTTVGNEYQRWWNGALESVIDNAPTVIEAEDGAE